MIYIGRTAEPQKTDNHIVHMNAVGGEKAFTCSHQGNPTWRSLPGNGKIGMAGKQIQLITRGDDPGHPENNGAWARSQEGLGKGARPPDEAVVVTI